MGNETPTYEEFLRNYKMDERVKDSYWVEKEAQVRGYGPCYSCGDDDLTFELEIVLKNSRGGWKKTTVYSVVSAREATFKIARGEGFWSNGDSSFSSRERRSLVNRINNAVVEHVVNDRNINRTVVNDIDDDDCTIL